MKIQHNLVPLARNLMSVIPTCIALILSGEAQAGQPVPDAGRLLREQPKLPPTLPSNPTAPITPAPTAQDTVDNSTKVLVKGFRIEGASLISEQELKGQIEDAIGKELSFSQLQQLADTLVVYYAKKGFLAQAVMPPQELDDGVVLIKVTEGKRGDILMNNQGKRVKSARAQGFIDHRIAKADVMNIDKLGEAIILLNEQPGTVARATLKPGASAGDTDLLVTIADKPLTTFNVGLSNKGSRGTGEAQAIAGVSLNNPLGLFDLANILVAKSEGSTFGLAEYDLAIGNSGLRAGFNLSRLDYKVTQSSLRALDAQGEATTFGLKAEYPLYRRPTASLSLAANLDTKHFRDETIAGESSDRRVNMATLGLGGNRQDNLGQGGITGFGVSWVHANTNEDNVAARVADNASRQTLGSYNKLMYNLDRQQKLAEKWAFVGRLRGQIAFDNVESSGRFSLGGADGLRAYPTGEAIADEGWLLSLNLVHAFTPKLQGTLFVDTGGVRVNHDTRSGINPTNPRNNNRYSLAGLGVGLDWKITDNLALTSILAAPIGSNPGRDVNGNDTDARDQNLRGWINLVGQF